MINIHDCSQCVHKMVCIYKGDFLALKRKLTTEDARRRIFGDGDRLLEGDLRCRYYVRETTNIKGV